MDKSVILRFKGRLKFIQSSVNNRMLIAAKPAQK